ncbi:hypothetical protein ACTNDG_05025 [Clostridium sp. HCP1S3_B4]|uniref:hypothetical protein n=1 Tax=unclassified Clostridium TaxID=2614128 RepID=UPI002A7D48CF|nr:hypothetical protein [Clostridiales bacterium]MDY2728609.1 hypothetical protein [Clostridium sp.]
MLVKEVEYYNNENTLNYPKKRAREEERKKYDELRRAKRNREKRKRAQSKLKRKIAFEVISVAFIAGIITLAIDSRVFNMQSQLTAINKQIETVKADNEDLTVKLLQTGSLDDIEINAQNRLGMVSTTKENIITVDLSKNYFQQLDDEDNAAKEENLSIYQKIKLALEK